MIPTRPKTLVHLPLVIVMVTIVLSRIVPHPPNISPLLAISLIGGARYSKRWAISTVLGSLLISDFILSKTVHFPMWGSWSFFTYSGLLFLTLLGSRLTPHPRVLPLFTYMSIGTVAFWVWTHLGTWLLSGMYPLTLKGLLGCFCNGLPFLRNLWVSSLAFVYIIAIYRQINGVTHCFNVIFKTSLFPKRYYTYKRSTK